MNCYFFPIVKLTCNANYFNQAYVSNIRVDRGALGVYPWPTSFLILTNHFLTSLKCKYLLYFVDTTIFIEYTYVLFIFTLYSEVSIFSQ